VSLEPCDLCKAAIKQSRIKKVYYDLEQEKSPQYKTIFKKINIKDKNLVLKNYFKKKR